MILFLIMLYFFGMVVMNIFAANWILELVYRSAGITKRQVRQYQQDHVGGRRRQLYASFWILSRSPEPKRTKKLIWLHQLAIAPAALGFPAVFAAITISIKNPRLGNLILICTAGFLLVYNLILALVGKLGKSKFSAQIPDSRPSDKEDHDPWEEDGKFQEDSNPQEEFGEENPADAWERDSAAVHEEYMRLYREHRKRRNAMRLVTLILIALIASSGLWLRLGKTSEPTEAPSASEPSEVSVAPPAEPTQTGETKTPPDADSLTDVLASHGFTPQEPAEPGISQEYSRCITVQEDGFFLEFYLYPEEAGAKNLYASVKSQRMALIPDPSLGAEEEGENYAMCRTSADQWYTITVRIDKTVLCLEGADEAALEELLAELVPTP